MSFYRDQLNHWLKRINVDAQSVLDIGGGEGPTKEKVGSFKSEKYDILDYDNAYRPDIFADLNVPWTSNVLPRVYDITFCLEVMEYVYDPVQAHRNIASSLVSGGVAYISYPSIYPLHNPVGIDYLRYTKNAIEKLLSMADFVSWEITPRVATRGMGNLKDFYLNEGMRAMKNTMDIYHIGYMVKAIRL